MSIKITPRWIVANSNAEAGASVVTAVGNIYAAAYAASIREKVNPLNARDNAHKAAQDFLNMELAEYGNQD